MTTVANSHIMLDERGRALVDGTRTKVTLIVRDKLAGMSPEKIRETYPSLSLAQVYAALAYYYDHQAELDRQIAQEDGEVAAIIARNSQPMRAELERRLSDRAATDDRER